MMAARACVPFDGVEGQLIEQGYQQFGNRYNEIVLFVKNNLLQVHVAYDAYQNRTILQLRERVSTYVTSRAPHTHIHIE